MKFAMLGNPHMTMISLEQAETQPGQASFALPNTEFTCRSCEHWANQRGERNHRGNLKEARCRKALLSLRDPPPVPHGAKACKHFAASLTPPAI
jgi:hypothetical protein